MQIVAYPEILINKQPLIEAEIKSPEIEGNCYEQFRLHNCNLDSPVGDICTRLHSCITKTTPIKTTIVEKSSETLNFSNNNNKIVMLEEFLENVLLILTGMGIFKICRKVVRSKVWLCRLKHLILKLGQRGRRGNQGNEMETIEEDDED